MNEAIAQVFEAILSAGLRVVKDGRRIGATEEGGTVGVTERTSLGEGARGREGERGRPYCNYLVLGSSSFTS